MDMFMDKLAQKLTAQEIIKANTAADVEELNKLKNQVAEYNECVTKLQKLIDEGFGKIADVQARDGETARIAGESAESVKALQEDMKEIRQLLRQSNERLESVDKSVALQLEFLSKSMGEKIDQLCGQLEAQASGAMSERLNEVEENVHKECVKVYRNVQAVMVEESGRQSETLNAVKDGVMSVRGRIGAILGISVVALIFSILSIVLQLLTGAGILSL